MVYNRICFFAIITSSVLLLNSCNSGNSHLTKTTPTLQLDVELLKDELFKLKIECAVLKEKVNTLQNDLDEINIRDEINVSKIGSLQEQLTSLQSSLDDLHVDFLVHKRAESIIINAKEGSDDKFQRLDSSDGYFFVSVKDVQPYLDGHKIVLQIGNPSNATFSKPVIKLSWTCPATPDLSGKKSQFKEKQFDISKDLVSGSWTDVECFITPSDLNSLRLIEMTIETSCVKLYNNK